MYKDFNKEQFDRDTLECDEGFIIYSKYPDNSIYIHILYVKPEYRKKGTGSGLEQKLIDKFDLEI